MHESVMKKIIDNKVIAVIYGIYGQQCLNLVSALNKGGITLIAITFDSMDVNQCEAAEETLSLINNQLGHVVTVGASSISNLEILEQARRAGASFIISPDAIDAIILTAVDEGLVSIAGALTPTEIIFAHNCGADIINVYPACSMGPAYFTNTRNMLWHIPMMAFGGINRNNVRLYLRAGAVGVCVDDCLYSNEQVANGEWEQISENTRQFLTTI